MSSRLKRIPRGVWVLGLVSLFMDLSSEMIHAILPLYLVTVFSASMLAVGVIEGIAEATAMLVKIFSGALSDWLGKRKLLAAMGYGLAAVTKPLFPLATGLGVIVAARFIDRVGKGIRGAPRDALIADLSPPAVRGAAFGLRQALDTVGAVIGPLAAIGFLFAFANDFVAVFWVAVIPAFLSFGLILFAVHDPAPKPGGVTKPLTRTGHTLLLPPAFWAVVAVGSVLTLARFSEAFLVLRAQNIGMPIATIPLVLVLMSIAYALTAYPAGVVSDRIGRFGVIMGGMTALILADLLLAAAQTIPLVLAG